ETCDLTHFLTYDLTKFTVEYVITYSDTFTRCVSSKAQHFCLVIRTVESEVPQEIRSFYRDDVDHHFHTTVTALTAVDFCIYETRSIRDLSLNDLICRGFLICSHIDAQAA